MMYGSGLPLLQLIIVNESEQSYRTILKIVHKKMLTKMLNSSKIYINKEIV